MQILKRIPTFECIGSAGSDAINIKTLILEKT